MNMNDKILKQINTERGKKAVKKLFDPMAKERFATNSKPAILYYRSMKTSLVSAGTLTLEEIQEIERKYNNGEVEETEYEWIEEVPEADLTIIVLALECYIENTNLPANKEHAQEILKAIEG